MGSTLVLLDNLVKQGLSSIVAQCVECDTKYEVPISALNLKGTTFVGDVPALRTLACPACSAPSRLILQDASKLELGAKAAC